MLKTLPKFERMAINAAIINQILIDHKEFLSCGGYISDGSRNISHETAFQDYLEKYFGFRKAYCKLNISYRFPVGLLLAALKPFKCLIRRYKAISLLHNINTMLILDEIAKDVD